MCLLIGRMSRLKSTIYHLPIFESLGARTPDRTIDSASRKHKWYLTFRDGNDYERRTVESMDEMTMEKRKNTKRKEPQTLSATNTTPLFSIFQLATAEDASEPSVN